MVKDSGSSLERMLALLDAFTHERYAWTVEALAEHFHLTPSSTYRYVKELRKAGLLVRLPGSVYVIGARVVELEALIRETDPVTRIGMPTLEALARETGCHVLFSNIYGNHLLNVAHVPGIEPLALTYLRGRTLPWFKGAPARSALAFWPKSRVRQLFNEHHKDADIQSLWPAFWKEIMAVRRAGYCVSNGELDPGLVGYGAPVFVEDEVIGTISLVCSKERAALLSNEAIGKVLMAKSEELSRILVEYEHA